METLNIILILNRHGILFVGLLIIVKLLYLSKFKGFCNIGAA